MSQLFEDRASEPNHAPKTAQVLPFERPRSELQRAVQARAQEAIDRARIRADAKPNPMRRIAAFALALIPVALLFLAIDGLLRVFHQVNDMYSKMPVPVQQPEEVEIDATASEPGVILLLPPKDMKRTPPAAPTR